MGFGISSRPSSLLLPFSSAIRFWSSVTVLQVYSVVGPINFTFDASGAQPGSSTIVRLYADGVNSPTFSGMRTLNASSGYDGRIGILNVLEFFWDGANCWVSIYQEENASSFLSFSTRTAGISLAGTTYTNTTVNMFTEYMLADKFLPAGSDGWVAIDSPPTGSVSSVLGLNASNLNQSYVGAYEYFVWSSSGTFYIGTNGAGATNTGVTSRNRYRLRRLSGTISAEWSTDGLVWNNFYTWPGSNSSNLYANVNFATSNSVSPSHQGFS